MFRLLFVLGFVSLQGRRVISGSFSGTFRFGGGGSSGLFLRGGSRSGSLWGWLLRARVSGSVSFFLLRWRAAVFAALLQLGTVSGGSLCGSGSLALFVLGRSASRAFVLLVGSLALRRWGIPLLLSLELFPCYVSAEAGLDFGGCLMGFIFWFDAILLNLLVPILIFFNLGKRTREEGRGENR